ncbi:hypothetical protein [Proteiniclasticum ruminis]|uniref:hypothetical protein n=1 Tax=Proteiniclasticum ruminis TaxID=398199 RepID=UPI0028A9016E|nr:hypothetical protein [Proteiniclasticum ruminis]
MNREDEFNEKPHENEENINEMEEVETRSEEVKEEPLYVEPKEKTDPYVYRGGSSYEPGVEERRRKKKFSGFSLIAIALIFTLLGTSLGVYGAFNLLPET